MGWPRSTHSKQQNTMAEATTAAETSGRGRPGHKAAASSAKRQHAGSKDDNAPSAGKRPKVSAAEKLNEPPRLRTTRKAAQEHQDATSLAVCRSEHIPSPKKKPGYEKTVPRKRRTPSEVAAANAAKKKAVADALTHKKHNYKQLVQIELEEEEKEDSRKANTICHHSDISIDNNDKTMEFANTRVKDCDDDGSDSSSDDEDFAAKISMVLLSASESETPAKGAISAKEKQVSLNARNKSILTMLSQPAKKKTGVASLRETVKAGKVKVRAKVNGDKAGKMYIEREPHSERRGEPITLL